MNNGMTLQKLKLAQQKFWKRKTIKATKTDAFRQKVANHFSVFKQVMDLIARLINLKQSSKIFCDKRT